MTDMDMNSEYTIARDDTEPAVSSVSCGENAGSGYVPAARPVPQVNASPAISSGSASPRSASFFSLPARIGLWVVGAAAGVTILFACVLVWAGGLRYLGVINDSDKAEQGNTYNFYVNGEKVPDEQAPSTEGDIEDFFNDYFGSYFGDFFGGSFGDPDDGFGLLPNGGSEATEPNTSDKAAGLGIKAVELALEFKIDDKYSAGLVIDTIEDYSSFIGTDVRVNDMIVAANGKPTTSVADLKSQFTAVGDDITLTIARYAGGVASTFDVTVELVAMQ